MELLSVYGVTKPASLVEVSSQFKDYCFIFDTAHCSTVWDLFMKDVSERHEFDPLRVEVASLKLKLARVQMVSSQSTIAMVRNSTCYRNHHHSHLRRGWWRWLRFKKKKKPKIHLLEGFWFVESLQGRKIFCLRSLRLSRRQALIHNLFRNRCYFQGKVAQSRQQLLGFCPKTHLQLYEWVQPLRNVTQSLTETTRLLGQFEHAESIVAL